MRRGCPTLPYSVNFGRIRSVSPSLPVSVSGGLFFAAGRLTIASRPTSSWRLFRLSANQPPTLSRMRTPKMAPAAIRPLFEGCALSEPASDSTHTRVRDAKTMVTGLDGRVLMMTTTPGGRSAPCSCTRQS
jgi:hypothetical protein